MSESQSFCGRVDHHTVVSPAILKGKVILIFYCCYWLWSQYFVIIRGVVKLMFATGSRIDSFEKGEGCRQHNWNVYSVTCNITRFLRKQNFPMAS